MRPQFGIKSERLGRTEKGSWAEKSWPKDSVDSTRQTDITPTKFPFEMEISKEKRDELEMRRLESVALGKSESLAQGKASHSEEAFKKNRRITKRKKRKGLIGMYPVLATLSRCNSKIKMLKIFKSLTSPWKRFIRNYMSKCFIYHLHIRQIKNFGELMRQRQNLYDALDDPEILMEKINFSNNLVKNFCKGISNFAVMFYEELLEQGLLPPPEKLTRFGGKGLSRRFLN